VKETYGVNHVFYGEQWCILKDFLNGKKITYFRNSFIDNERIKEMLVKELDFFEISNGKKAGPKPCLFSSTLNIYTSRLPEVEPLCYC
jgi:hypothetical protein